MALNRAIIDPNATTVAARSRRLPALPAMPKGRGATSWNGCRCGCGGFTQSTFVPGHDARLKGLMVRVLRDVMDLDEVEEWGGKDVRAAVEAGLQDPKLIKRWNLEGDVEAAREAASDGAEEQEEQDEAEEPEETEETSEEPEVEAPRKGRKPKSDEASA